MNGPISYLANTDEYTMYFFQSMQQPDKEYFVGDIVKEFNVHCKRKNWKIITKDQVLKVN